THPETQKDHPTRDGLKCTKGSPCTGRPFRLRKVRRRPTLPQGLPCSTIGAERLSFRVRNETGRFPLAITTETSTHHTPTSAWQISVSTATLFRYQTSPKNDQRSYPENHKVDANTIQKESVIKSSAY